MKKVNSSLIVFLMTIIANVVVADSDETVHFASSKLEEIVCQKLGVEPPVNKTKMLELTYLVVQHEGEEATGIDDLSGIEYAINLKKLFLYDNPIRDLSPLSKLKNLEGMQLDGKYIEDISPLAALTSLEWLDLSDAPITDISPLAGLKNLEDLNLTKNRISDISPLSKLVNLKRLTIIYNQISDISAMSTLTNLESLTVHTNQISDISTLSSLSSLEDIDLSWNQISDVSPLVHLTNLTHLQIFGNPLNEEAYDIHFPKMLKDNPNLFVATGRNLHPSIPKTQLKFYLGPLSMLSLFGLLVMYWGRKTIAYVERCDIEDNAESTSNTNLLPRKRFSMLALESLGFAVSALILVGICVFIVFALDAFPVGQAGGMSLVVQASLISLFAFGSCVAALIMGLFSLYKIIISKGRLIGGMQACCGLLLSLVALVFGIVSSTYLR